MPTSNSIKEKILTVSPRKRSSRRKPRDHRLRSSVSATKSSVMKWEDVTSHAFLNSVALNIAAGALRAPSLVARHSQLQSHRHSARCRALQTMPQKQTGAGTGAGAERVT